MRYDGSEERWYVSLLWFTLAAIALFCISVIIAKLENGSSEKQDREVLIEQQSPASISKCGTDMVFVESLNLCVDKEEMTGVNGQPVGNMNYNMCKTACEMVGKRLPTDREWVSSCEGTPKDKCNIYAEHPIEARLKSYEPWKFKGVDCKAGNNAYGVCMLDPSLYKGSVDMNDIRYTECLSKAGVHNMIGSLGEWVEEGWFNGGLFPQEKSSCSYSTRAHSKEYKDYSIGCRCVTTP